MLFFRNSAEFASDPLMVMKFWILVSGIYIREIVTTLDFQWSVFRRRRYYRWTILFYSASRLSGIGVIILILTNFYGTSPINCQAWVTSGWAFSAFGVYGLSSILIMLRIFAIWEKSKVIMAVSVAIWMFNLGFQLAGIVKIRAVWMPAARSCAIANVQICRDLSANLLITDVILLSIILAGLRRFHRGVMGLSYISHLLWQQGVIWLAIATAAQLPQVLLLFISDSLNLLFLLPAMVATIIAATRTYRFLISSTSPPDTIRTGPESPNLQNIMPQRLLSGTSDPSVVHMPSSRLEVQVHRHYHEESPTSSSDDNIEGRHKKMSGSEEVAAHKPAVAIA